MKLHPQAKLSKYIFSKNVEAVPTRDGYGEGVFEAGEKDVNVVVLCCDLSESTKSNLFAKKFPERFIEVGIAEQNMAGIASGLALAGKIPFISSYAVFSPGRNWDQIRVSLCYQKANVKVAGAHAGLSVGPDGATHQALEDIAITRVLPEMTVIVPCDVHETRKATLACAQAKGPMYIRFAREKTSVLTTPQSPFSIGKVEIFKEGKDVSLIACGPLLYETLLAAFELSKIGIDAQVINCHTIKPLDKNNLLRLVKETRAVVTIEEHQIYGGLRGAIAEFFGENFPVPIRAVGMPDSFGESGEPSELLKKYGMTPEAIVNQAKIAIRMKS